jgi:hypothetical protein
LSFFLVIFSIQKISDVFPHILAAHTVGWSPEALNQGGGKTGGPAAC